MTAGELRDILKDVPDDRLVVISRDAEGNDYSPLYQAHTDEKYIAHTSYSGECPHEEDLIEEYYSRKEIESVIDVVLLVPVN